MEQTQSIESLIQDINKGRTVLPEFQRDFVWEKIKTVDLFDSIVKDIFIGAIIYGIPSFEITTRQIDTRPRKKKGKKRKSLESKHYTLDEILQLQKLDRSNFRLILDGQQRITSIYRAITGIDEIFFVAKNKSEFPEELADSKISEIPVEQLLYSFDIERADNRLSIALSDVYKMISDDLLESECLEQYLRNTEYYQNLNVDNTRAIERYFLSLKRKIYDLFKAEKLLSFYLLDMSLDKFVLFFERSNSRGVQLNFIDILTAKLYNGFNLKESIKAFETSNSGYNLVPELIVRTIAYIISKRRFQKSGKGIEIHRTFILTELNSEHFNELWDNVTTYYKNAIDYLFQNNYILHQSWMPYQNMLIPLIIFQIELDYGFDQMSDSQKMFIDNWYWSSVFSQRYTGSSNEKIIQDCNILTLIAHNQKIGERSYFNKLFKTQIRDSKDLFSYNKKQNAVYRGILNFINYALKGYLDWNNTSKINFNLKNIDDHHIFPKDYISKNSSEESEERDFIDCVINRTLIPKITNIKIGSKAPSIYLKDIKENKNPNLENSLKTHAIDTGLLEGQYDDNFIFFLELRAEEIFSLINDKVYSRQEQVQKEFFKEIEIDKTKSIKVFARYYSKIVNGSFNPSNGTLSYNGKIFDSPSGAGIQAKIDLGASEDTTVNGWTFWRYVDPMTNEDRYIDYLRKNGN